MPGEELGDEGFSLMFSNSRQCLAFSERQTDGFCLGYDLGFFRYPKNIGTLASYYARWAGGVGDLLSNFELKKAQNYIDIIRLNKSAAMKSLDSRQEEISETFPEGTYAAVKNRTADRIYVDIPVAGGDINSGWFPLEELVPKNWSAPQFTESGFQIRVAYARCTNYGCEDGQFANDRLQNDRIASEWDFSRENSIQWRAIEISAIESGLRQYIFPNPKDDSYGNLLVGDSSRFVGLVDLNFDGYQDLRIAGGGADRDIFYIFDKEKNQFLYHEELSKFGTVQIDIKDKEIRVVVPREGGGGFWQRFRWRGNVMLPIYGPSFQAPVNHLHPDNQRWDLWRNGIL